MHEIKKNLWRIYLCKFFSSFWLIAPVLVPYFVENGLNATQVFMVEALFWVSMLLFEIPSGYLSDIMGRKKSKKERSGRRGGGPSQRNQANVQQIGEKRDGDNPAVRADIGTGSGDGAGAGRRNRPSGPTVGHRDRKGGRRSGGSA